MKAMILSAGFGTRLKPYTDDLPKALVPYKNVPMINYQIDRLKKTNVNEIIVNVHHHQDKMIKYFSENDFGVNIHLIVEKDILGTGGGILNAEKYLKNEEFFIVVNVDVDTNISLSDLIEYHKTKNPFASVAVQKRMTKRYLEFDPDMNLIGRANPDSDKKNLYAFNGIHIISNRIFQKGFEIKFEDILNIYFDVIKDEKEFVSGFDAGNASFKDLGKTENLSS